MIRWRWERPVASGKRTGWAKTFTGFDPALKGAKAFTGGAYLDAGTLREDPEGTLIVQVAPVGSVKNGSYECQIFRVGTGGPEPVGAAIDWVTDWLAVKDAARALLAAPEPEPAWITFRCEKCGRRVQLEPGDAVQLDDGALSCPYHAATYWLRREVNP